MKDRRRGFKVKLHLKKQFFYEHYIDQMLASILNTQVQIMSTVLHNVAREVS